MTAGAALGGPGRGVGVDDEGGGSLEELAESCLTVSDWIVFRHRNKDECNKALKAAGLPPIKEPKSRRQKVKELLVRRLGKVHGYAWALLVVQLLDKDLDQQQLEALREERKASLGEVEKQLESLADEIEALLEELDEERTRAETRHSNDGGPHDGG